MRKVMLLVLVTASCAPDEANSRSSDVEVLSAVGNQMPSPDARKALETCRKRLYATRPNGYVRNLNTYDFAVASIKIGFEISHARKMLQSAGYEIAPYEKPALAWEQATAPGQHPIDALGEITAKKGKETVTLKSAALPHRVAVVKVDYHRDSMDIEKVQFFNLLAKQYPFLEAEIRSEMPALAYDERDREAVESCKPDRRMWPALTVWPFSNHLVQVSLDDGGQVVRLQEVERSKRADRIELGL